MESIKKSYTIGMRFKMRFEGEEAPEQRYVPIKLVLTGLYLLNIYGPSFSFFLVLSFLISFSMEAYVLF